MKPEYKPGIADDLNVVWDPGASRLARVYVSRGRVEIVLCESDPEWVSEALRTLMEEYPEIVIANPEAGR